MSSLIAPSWHKRLALLSVAYLVVIATYWPTFSDMVLIWWTSSTFNHCFLIPPIAVFLVFESRNRLAGLEPGFAPLALTFMVANGLLWAAGALVDIAFFQHLAAVGMLIGVSWLLIGPRAARMLLFPLFYLYFSVPEGEFLVPYLQDWTAEVLVVMLRMTDVPVFIEGRYLSIPSGNFVVAEACSGINYLIAGVSVSSMYAYLRFHTTWRRFAFMLLAVAVPLIANGLRAYGIVMIADLSDYKYAMGVDHFVYGWVFFGIVIFALFALGNLFDQPDAMEVVPASGLTQGPRNRRQLPLMAAALLAILGPRLVYVGFDQPLPVAPAIDPPAITGWQLDVVEPLLAGKFQGESQYLHAVYTADGVADVHLEVHYFAAEVPGNEVINQTNAVFNAKKFQQLGHAVRALNQSQGPPVINEATVRRGNQEYLIWHWYDIGGRQVATRIRAKLAQAAAQFVRADGGSAAVVLFTPYRDVADGRQRLSEFLNRHELGLDAMYRAN